MRTKQTPTIRNIFKEEETVFFIDDKAVDQFNKEHQPVINAGNNAKKLYEISTGYRIETFPQLMDMATDLQKFVHDQHMREKGEQLKKVVDLGFEMPVNYQKITNGNFDVIQSSGKKFIQLMDRSNPAHFTIKDSEVCLSDMATKRRDSKARFTASTAEQKERLRIADEFIALCRQVEDHLLSIYPHSTALKQAIELKAYIKPLPHFVQLVNTKQGIQMIPSLGWVNECFGGTNKLGYYVNSQKDIQRIERDSKPKLGEPHVFFRKMMPGAEIKTFFCTEAMFDERYRGKEGIELMPGKFNSQQKPYGTPIQISATSYMEGAFK
jgi:hypothetical protein